VSVKPKSLVCKCLFTDTDMSTCGIEGKEIIVRRQIAPRIAYFSIRQHTSAYVSIRQHTSALTHAYQPTANSATRNCEESSPHFPSCRCLACARACWFVACALRRATCPVAAGYHRVYTWHPAPQVSVFLHICTFVLVKQADRLPAEQAVRLLDDAVVFGVILVLA
jgi:hypothetical protein